MPKYGKPVDDYEAQDDARTLTRAEEIKGDSKRMGKAMTHVSKAHKAHAALMEHYSKDGGK